MGIYGCRADALRLLQLHQAASRVFMGQQYHIGGVVGEGILSPSPTMLFIPHAQGAALQLLFNVVC